MFGIGRFVGWLFITARDALARVLVRARVTPNILTIVGTLFTAGAGACLAAALWESGGRDLDFSAWTRSHLFFILAAGCLILSSACDMLDGAVARIGNLSSSFGAFLDSSMDRIADFFLWTGMAAGYAILDKPNITFILLCMIANMNCFMISYTKSRAETQKLSLGPWLYELEKLSPMAPPSSERQPA